ncbi:MAG: hypothetical protein PVJ84_09235 [Desulfobacteraceae bacterium]|jgi:hypothetical protein
MSWILGQRFSNGFDERQEVVTFTSAFDRVRQWFNDHATDRNRNKERQ